MTPLLDISDLAVAFHTAAGTVSAVDGIDLALAPGEILGLVGESGSGKSVTALTILRLIRPPGHIVRGRMLFEGCDLASASETEMRAIRGARIALVSQNPRTALNPVIPVGRQIARLFRLRRGVSRQTAQRSAIEMLARVGIREPAQRARQYAHQLSGGTCQRVMIAMALATAPRLLIADEPTTGLDASIAARVLELLRELGSQTGAAILLITHDLGIVAETCDRVAVMHAGQLVEAAPVRALFHHPAHPYTRALLHAIPRIDADVTPEPIAGVVPSLLHPPPGCRYQARCPQVMAICSRRPPRTIIASGHSAACFAVASVQEGGCHSARA